MFVIILALSYCVWLLYIYIYTCFNQPFWILNLNWMPGINPLWPIDMTPYGINELGQRWFSLWLGTWVNHNPNQCWRIASWTHRNIYERIFVPPAFTKLVLKHNVSLQNGGHFLWASITCQCDMKQPLQRRHMSVMASKSQAIQLFVCLLFTQRPLRVPGYCRRPGGRTCGRAVKHR